MNLKLKDLLKHEMIVKWLNQKWNKYGVWLYLVNLVIYLCYLFVLTGFALNLPNPQSDTCKYTCTRTHVSIIVFYATYKYQRVGRLSV